MGYVKQDLFHLTIYVHHTAASCQNVILSFLNTITNQLLPAVNRTQGYSDETNFLLFDAIWTFLVAVPFLVLSPLYLQQFAHKYALIAVEAITLLFWFAGFIAVAAILPPSAACSRSSVCKGLQAATVFGAFEWFVLFISTSTSISIPVFIIYYFIWLTSTYSRLLFVATTVLVVVLPLMRGGGDSTPKPEPAVDMQAHPDV